MSNIINNQMIEEIRNLLISSRLQLQQSVNSVMVQTYWNIGKIIVEDEQDGQERAAYGKKQLEQISNIFTKVLGKGFDKNYSKNFERVLSYFPNSGDTVSQIELESLL